MDDIVFIMTPYVSQGYDLKEALELEGGNTVESLKSWATKLAWTAEQLFSLAEKIESTVADNPDIKVSLHVEGECINIDCDDEYLRDDIIAYDIIDVADQDDSDDILGCCEDCGNPLFDCVEDDLDYPDWYDYMFSKN